MINDHCVEIRRTSFRKSLDINKDLQSMVREFPSHKFLVNPASQNTFLYQVEFVQAFSESHFRKRISQLSILDWGCGKGHVSFLLNRRGANVTSCDYCSSDAADDDSAFGQDTPIIHSNKMAVNRLKDAIRMPYQDREFDVVLSFGVLEHVDDDFESLKEVRRILRPGGVFFCFNLPYVLSWTQRVSRMLGDNYHDRLYNRALVERLLPSAGFEMFDFWHRQLLPKNRIRYPFYRLFESLDQFLVGFTPLKYLATNVEFVAVAR